MDAVDTVLQQREAQGLHYTILARIFVGLLALIITPIVGQSMFEILITCSLLVLLLAIIGYFFFLLHKRKRLLVVGLGAALLDISILSGLPVIWYYVLGGQDAGAASMLKTQLPSICLLLIVINSLAMRPLYPVLITIGAVAICLSFLPFITADPRIIWSSNLAEVFSGPAVSFELYIFILLGIILTGGLLSWSTYHARNTIQEAATCEHENVLMQERQAQLILQGKMDAISSLVAGIAHEVNNPISVIKSASDTLERYSDKLPEILESSKPLESIKRSKRLQTFLKVLADLSLSIGDASGRIVNLVDRMQYFAQLDKAEYQSVNIHTSIDNTLILLKPELRENIMIIKEYGDIPDIYCYSRQLNYVFMELLTNAIEAILDQGAITIRTRPFFSDSQSAPGRHDSISQRICIQIADSGKGIPPEQIDGLFDIHITPQQSRMSMSMSLPIIYNIVHKHQGDITVDSEVGKGTIISMTLPVKSGNGLDPV